MKRHSRQWHTRPTNAKSADESGWAARRTLATRGRHVLHLSPHKADSASNVGHHWAARGICPRLCCAGGGTLVRHVPAACSFAYSKAEDKLRRKRHRWIKDALIAIGVALTAVGVYELLDFFGAVLVGGP